MRTSGVVVEAYAGGGGRTIQFVQECQIVIGKGDNVVRLTTVV